MGEVGGQAVARQVQALGTGLIAAKERARQSTDADPPNRRQDPIRKVGPPLLPTSTLSFLLTTHFWYIPYAGPIHQTHETKQEYERKIVKIYAKACFAPHHRLIPQTPMT